MHQNCSPFKENRGVRESALYALAKFSHSREGAETVRHSDIWKCFPLLLDSLYSQSHRFTCQILGNLAAHGPACAVLLTLTSYARISVLLRDSNDQVQRCAAYALSKLTRWPQGAQAAADARVLEYVLEPLQSQDAEVLKWTCQIIGNVLSLKYTSAGELSTELCALITVLLRHEDKDVCKSVLALLPTLTQRAQGAQVAGDVKILEYVSEALLSPDAEVLKWTCEMLGNLVLLKCTSVAELSTELVARITVLLGRKLDDVCQSALRLLWIISQCHHGAQTVRDTSIMEYVPSLLKHDKTGSLTFRTQIRSYLSDKDSDVRKSAMFVLGC
ncbi:armadillo-type protein [Mycena galopus ATCC 62051]|nr:armadillo-type protein [Mycena galopus ATCC 62051]